MEESRPTPRVLGYDLARAFAVFGMVLVNFKVAMSAGARGPEWMRALAGAFDGRAAATFVVLAGIGISLMSRRAREDDDPVALGRSRRILLKRALFLFVVGLVYTPLWPGDILHFYGLYLAVASFLLAASSSVLLGLAASAIFGYVALILVFDYETGWNFEELTYSGLFTPAGMVRHMLFNGFHPLVPWIGFLLLGMVLGRLDLRDRRTRWRVLVAGLCVAGFAEITSRLLLRSFTPGLEGEELMVVQAVFGTEPMPPLPLYMLAGSGTATVVVAVSVALAERFGETMPVRALAATGQLALTLYVAHVILGMGALDVMGRLENQDLGFALLATTAFFALAVVFSARWRSRFRRGPLEAVMRAITG